MELGQLTIMRSMSLVSAPFWHARGTGWPGRGHGLSGCKLLARPCWRSKHAARCICRRLLRMAVTRSGRCTSLLYGVALAGRNAVNLLLTYHTTCNGHFLERSRPVTFNTSRARSAHSFFGPKAERHPATLQRRPADLLRPSEDVHWCTCSAAGIVAQLVTQPSPGVASSTPSARCRRPKAKYDSGPTPAELTSTAATIHIRFEPRIWLAGRRLMSMTPPS